MNKAIALANKARIQQETKQSWLNNNRDCGCMGMPTEPPVCSEECYYKYMDKIGAFNENIITPITPPTGICRTRIMSKKLTYEMFSNILGNTTTWMDGYKSILPYLADEQPEEHPTKPEPSRLDIAKEVLLNMMNARTYAIAANMVEFAYQCADELIKQAKI